MSKKKERCGLARGDGIVERLARVEKRIFGLFFGWSSRLMIGYASIPAVTVRLD